MKQAIKKLYCRRTLNTTEHELNLVGKEQVDLATDRKEI